MPEIASGEHHSWFVFLRSVARNSTRRPAVLTYGWGREVRGFIQSFQENVATVQSTHDQLLTYSLTYLLHGAESFLRS